MPKRTRGAGGDPDQRQHFHPVETGHQVIKSEQKLVRYSEGLKELAQSLVRESTLFLLGPRPGSGLQHLHAPWDERWELGAILALPLLREERDQE